MSSSAVRPKFYALSKSMWGRQSCLQPAFRPAGPAGKRVRSLKGCPTIAAVNNGRSEWSERWSNALFQRSAGSVLRSLLCLALAALASAAAAPRRIISTSPAVTELLYGVGAFDRVVAVTEYCLYPPEAKALPKVGGWSTPSVEKVASFRPDLVALAEAQAPFLKNPLEQLGIATVLVPGQTVQDAFTAIGRLGKATGHEQQAAALAARTQAALDTVRRRAAGLSRPRVLIIVDRTPGTLREMYAALPESFLAELAEIAGGKVAGGQAASGYGKVSPETVLTANPDFILDVIPASKSDAGPNPAAAWRELPELNAVRRGHVQVVREEYVTHDSQMIAKTAVLFARVLHPEVPAGEWEGR